MSNELEHLLDDGEVAALLRLKNPKTLAVWRCTNRYPTLRWVKVGRLVRYRLSDVVSFIEERTSHGGGD